MVHVIVTIRPLSLLDEPLGEEARRKDESKGLDTAGTEDRDAKNTVLLGATKRLGVARQGAYVHTPY